MYNNGNKPTSHSRQYDFAPVLNTSDQKASLNGDIGRTGNNYSSFISKARQNKTSQKKSHQPRLPPKFMGNMMNQSILSKVTSYNSAQKKFHSI